MLSALKYVGRSEDQPTTVIPHTSEKHNVFSRGTTTIAVDPMEGALRTPGEYPIERRLKMRLARQNTFGFNRLKPVLVPAANTEPVEGDTECNGPLHEHIQHLKGDGANVTLLPSHSFLEKPNVVFAPTTTKSLNKHIENLKQREKRQSPAIGRTTLFNESPLMGRRVQIKTDKDEDGEATSEQQAQHPHPRNHEVEIVVEDEIVETSPLVHRV